jgi:hypothetical protein
MLQAAVLGGLFTGILSALPIVNFGNCCCLWILGGGALAAYLDAQNRPGPSNAGRGALVGLASGVAGACIYLIVAMMLDPLILPLQQRLAEQLLRVAQDVPPEVRDSLESMGDGSQPLAHLGWFIVMLFIGSAFSAIGGALSAAFFRKDVPPALGGPIAPPPLP